MIICKRDTLGERWTVCGAPGDGPCYCDVMVVATPAEPLPTPIYRYTRAQALADGVLHDVTMVAQEAGFRWPVALTDALWKDINDIPPRLAGIADVEGRLWDVLWMGRLAARAVAPDEPACRYELLMPVGNQRARRYWVRAVASAGDHGEPVITLMRPDES
jgi:hypothetical protein